MSTSTISTPVTYRIVNAPSSSHTFQIERVEGTNVSLVRDKYNDVRTFTSRGSARKAITRLNRSL